MTDWEDASRDELMARLDGALERLKLDAEVEAALHFDQMLDETAEYSWPPAPSTAHPGLAEHASWVRDFIAKGNWRVYLPRPRKLTWAFALDQEPELAPISHICLTVRQCYGPAPYVGRPFIYLWKAATDESGRWVATDSEPDYDPRWRP